MLTLLIGLIKSRKYWNIVQSHGFFADRSGSNQTFLFPAAVFRTLLGTEMKLLALNRYQRIMARRMKEEDGGLFEP